MAKVLGWTSLLSVVVVNALFLCAYPAAIYWSARKSGMSAMAGGLSAFLSLIVGVDTTQKHLFGLQSWSFTWEVNRFIVILLCASCFVLLFFEKKKGWGLYTQIVAAVWAFLAWGQSCEFIVEGRGFFRASVFLVKKKTKMDAFFFNICFQALSWLSHLIVGYGVSAITIVLVAAAFREGMPEKAVWHAFLRWLALNVTTALLISYLILPTLVEAHILNRSRFEPPEYWDSYGAATCIKWLFKV